MRNDFRASSNITVLTGRRYVAVPFFELRSEYGPVRSVPEFRCHMHSKLGPLKRVVCELKCLLDVING